MDVEDRHRSIGVVTIVAGAMSLASLVVGLAGAGYDFEAFDKASTFVALGADAAEPIRWGLWLSMFGSYLLMVPIAVHLTGWLRRDDSTMADVSTVGAGFYILLGAAGACVLASTLPYLMKQYSGANAVMRADIVRDFDLARRIGEDGLQGVAQNVAGAAWFIGMGYLLRRHRRGLGALAMVVGAALVLNAVGILVDVEALRLIGLTGNVLLAPAWAIGLGASLLRSPSTPGGEASRS
ncbi:MAG: hypothetical protein ACRD12_16665 [Acidimicrobiales bacterium]